MTGLSTEPTTSPAEDALTRGFAHLKGGYERAPNPPLAERLAHLERLERGLLADKEEVATVIDQDFGGRSKHESVLAEVYVTVEAIRYLKKHLAAWVQPERRRVSLPFLPARAEVRYQPKGVVGVLAPWNYPVQLALVPLASALAAGNRVMLKPSELTPRTSEWLAAFLSGSLPSDLVQTVTGGPDVGARFAALPFDHIFFTGSTQVGRLVMRAAAENLTPVTLELGGKSPTILHESYPVETAAEAIVAGKWLNAGQTCIAPDYVLVPEARRDALVEALAAQVRRAYPRLRDNPDYTSIVNARHKARLEGYVRDAREQGALVRELAPEGESLEGTNKLAPTLLTEVTDTMTLMQEEIFGPLLPLVTYRRLDDAIRYVNERPRPLALYYFDHDARRAREVLDRTVSGGACVNSCVLHVGQDDLPFGGIGPSGMGAYHGREGFETFSHKKGVFHQARLNGLRLLSPPYGATLETLLKVLLRG